MGFVFKALTMCAFVAAPLAANAELIHRGDGMLYDTVLDVTWLQDANYARSSGYDADGRMTWDEATEWAENLVYAGLDDWRLPNLGDPFTELDYMFYINLGNTGYGSAPAEVHADHANFNRGQIREP